jgi:hypothetical protein
MFRKRNDAFFEEATQGLSLAPQNLAADCRPGLGKKIFHLACPETLLRFLR